MYKKISELLFQISTTSYLVFSFIHWHLSRPELREIRSEVLRHFLHAEAYSFHFWCKRAFTVAKNITFGLFVIKEQLSKPSSAMQK